MCSLSSLRGSDKNMLEYFLQLFLAYEFPPADIISRSDEVDIPPGLLIKFHIMGFGPTRTN